jgi:hypothetical protein
MDREIVPILVKAFLDSMNKEGRPVSEQSVASTLEPILDALESVKPLSATQRHAIAADRHINDACKERDRMARELASAYATHEAATRELRQELTVVIKLHRNRLDWLEPNYEGLKRDYDSIKSINASSLAMITVGGVLMSVASFLTAGMKYGTLGAGILATFCGLWIQWFVIYRSPASRERPLVGEAISEHPLNAPPPA